MCISQKIDGSAERPGLLYDLRVAGRAPAFSFDDTLAAPESVARTLSARHPVVLVQNDAVLTCGRTPLEAFDRLEVTDYSAKAAIAARSFGGLRPITDAQVEDLVTAFNLPRE